MTSLRLFLLFLAAVLLSALPLRAEYRFVASSRYVKIYGTRETAASTQKLRDMLDDAIDEIQRETGIYLDDGPDIYIVPDSRSYQSLSLGRQRVVEFSDAFYSGKEGRIYIKSREQLGAQYLKILTHEYIHWYIEQLLEGATLWFHEGMAMLFARQLSWESYIYFTQQRFFGRHSNLFEMSYRYPDNPNDWQIYYLTSHFAISYLKNKKPEGWKRFWNQVAFDHKQGRKSVFIRTFGNSFHTSLLDFNNEFDAHCQSLAWQYLILGFNTLLFAFLPFLVLYIYFKRRKRMKSLPDLPLPDEGVE
ncbi:MAG: hypothetical protein WCY64_07840 [Candidatus Cloacimonadaceae bacterium]